jgi:hypothetical protein
MAKIIEFYIPQSFRKVSKGCRQTQAGSCWSFQWRSENPRDMVRKPHGEDDRAGRGCGEINELAASLMP